MEEHNDIGEKKKGDKISYHFHHFGHKIYKLQTSFIVGYLILDLI